MRGRSDATLNPGGVRIGTSEIYQQVEEIDFLHMAIPDSSKLGLMRNLKAITKKDIELHAAKITDISEYIERLSNETDEVTIASIRSDNRKKTKTFEQSKKSDKWRRTKQ